MLSHLIFINIEYIAGNNVFSNSRQMCYFEIILATEELPND